MRDTQRKTYRIQDDWERVARRAHAERSLERVLQPGDHIQAKSGEARELRRVGLCNLREALSLTRPVRRKRQEKVGRWTYAK